MPAEWYYGSREGFVEFIAPVAAGFVRPENRIYGAIKRGFDLVAALGGLALLLPLFPFIVFLIKLETPGPVFFRQQRVGRQRQALRLLQVPLDGRGRRGPQGQPGPSERGQRRGLQDQGRSRASPGSAASCGAAAWTSSPSCSTCCAARCRSSARGRRSPARWPPTAPAQALRLLVGTRSDLPVAGVGSQPPGFLRMDGAGPASTCARRCLGFDLHILLRTLPAVIERKGAY